MSYLSDRLAALADWVPPGSRVVDVGTDHALLPVHLVHSGRIVSAVATDIAQGPFEAAQRQVRHQGLTEAISVRLGPGLSTVSEDEAEVVVIAGMGGSTAVEVLEAASIRMGVIRRLIVQPMNANGAIRRFLYQSGFHLIGEMTVQEDGRLYDLLAAEPGPFHTAESRDPAYTAHADDAVALACAFELGPLRLARPTPADVAYVESAADRWKHIVDAMERSRAEATVMRRSRLAAQLQWVNAWLVRTSPGT